MKKNKLPISELIILGIGELIVSLLVVGGYFITDLIFDNGAFSYKVITGVILGSLIAFFNYFFLAISVNRAVNRFLELRGTEEMDDEAAGKFAKENSAPIQTAMTVSFIIRTITMLATLVIALLLDFFAPLATVIPLLAFRPILTLGEMLRVKLTAKRLSPVLNGFNNALSATDEEGLSEEEYPDKKESDE